MIRFFFLMTVLIGQMAFAAAVNPLDVVETLQLIPVGESNSTNVWRAKTLDRSVDIKALRQECSITPSCQVHRIKETENSVFYVVRTVEPPEDQDNESVFIVIEQDEAGKASQVWGLKFRNNVARTTEPTLHQTPYGEILQIQVRWYGTGNLRTDVFFVWRKGKWLEIDGKSWESGIELPPCFTIWKGLSIDMLALTVESPVWIEGDGNCCPSGGKLTVQLELDDRVLRIVQQEHSPTDASYYGPGSIEETWREKYLKDCLKSQPSD